MRTGEVGSRSVSGRRRAGRWLPRLLVLAASMVTLAGLGQLTLGWMPALSSVAEPVRPWAAASDGVAANVREAQWVEMDHEEMTGGPGYQMPLSMMPGMPADGQARLAVSVTVTNTTEVGRPVDPAQEFVLRNTSGDDSWHPVSDTFAGLSRLGPGSASDGVLFFDLPVPDNDKGQLYVAWEHGDDSVRLSVEPGSGENVTHSHPS